MESHKISLYHIKSHQMFQISPNLAKSHLSRNCTKSPHISLNLTNSHHIAQNLAMSHHILQNLAKSHRISAKLNVRVRLHVRPNYGVGERAWDVFFLLKKLLYFQTFFYGWLSNFDIWVTMDRILDV